jgi:MFS family permease
MCFRSIWSSVNPPLRPPPPRKGLRSPAGSFLLLFALANAGAVIAYTPFLSLLLPAKVGVLAGSDRIAWLGAATLFGAIAASIGNILFGWASDLVGTRRIWSALGLILTIASFSLLHQAQSKPEIVGAVVLYQLCLNMLLAPLFAWAADVVPDGRKGVLGGLIAAGQPLGALAGVIATLPLLGREWMQLGVVAAMVVLLIAPLLLSAPKLPPLAPAIPPEGKPALRRDFALAWTARLLMQVAGNVMFAFLLYYFLSLPTPVEQSNVARLSAASLTLAFPLALLAGRLSDRLGPRKPFLVAAATLAAIGLGAMAAAPYTNAAIAGYVLFSSAAAIFASLHTGYSMQLLPSARWRGRDMGVLNLTNTLPAIAAPALTMLLVPQHGFSLLLGLLSGLALIAAACVALIRTDNQGEAVPARPTAA